MKNIKMLQIICVGLLLMSFSCKKESINKLEDCNLENIVKKVADKEGTIWYDNQAKRYSVFTSVEGTYDSQDIGIVCNLPDNFKTEGLKVLFTGSYYNCEEFTPLIPGQKYYYLKLTKINLVSKE